MRIELAVFNGNNRVHKILGDTVKGDPGTFFNREFVNERPVFSHDLGRQRRLYVLELVERWQCLVHPVQKPHRRGAAACTQKYHGQKNRYQALAAHCRGRPGKIGRNGRGLVHKTGDPVALLYNGRVFAIVF